MAITQMGDVETLREALRGTEVLIFKHSPS
jgi:hypothetical protein